MIFLLDTTRMPLSFVAGRTTPSSRLPIGDAFERIGKGFQLVDDGRTHCR
jgi:hypothetical protein